MTKEIIIELDNVWKTYKMGTVEVHALRGMSLKVKKGELDRIKRNGNRR